MKFENKTTQEGEENDKLDKGINGRKSKADKKKISHKSRLNIIKMVLAFAGVLLLLTPAGSTTPQVNMYSMVTSMGIDKGAGGVRCTAEIILPVEAGGAKGESVIVQGDGTTLSSAIENLSISLGRTLDISHCALFVVGKDKAQEGVLDELRFLLSGGKVSPEMSIVLSGNNDAAEFINKLNKYGDKLDIDNLIKYLDYGSHNFSQTLLLFLNETYSKSQTSVMPCIEMGDKANNQNAIEADDRPLGEQQDESQSQSDQDGEDSDGGSDSGSDGNGGGGGGGSGGEGGKTEKPTVVSRTENIGVFKNGKLTALWGAKESNGIAYRDIKTKNGHFILHNVQVGDKTIDKISCYLIKKKLKTGFKMQDGTPTLCYKIDAQFMLEERYKLYDVSDGINADMPKDAYAAIKRALTESMTDNIMTVLDSSRRDGCDALLISDYFYKFRKKDYDRFQKSGTDILDNCNIKIDFDINLN